MAPPAAPRAAPRNGPVVVGLERAAWRAYAEHRSALVWAKAASLVATKVRATAIKMLTFNNASYNHATARGSVDYSGYAAIGTVSNVAQQLCCEAKPGQILIIQRPLEHRVSITCDFLLIADEVIE
jgi:hypothetical protein